MGATDFQVLGLSFFQHLKLPVGLTIGEKGLVLEHLLKFLGSFHGGVLGRVDGVIHKTLPDVTNGLAGGMNHIFLIETVVAKFIEEDLISRKIMCIVVRLADLVHGH